MSQERFAFTVIHRASDLVMEEKLPTSDGHTLSFVGRKANEQDPIAETALAYLHKRLGFTALDESRLGRPEIVTYNDKIGYFFKLLIPGDTEIKTIDELDGSRIVVKRFDQVLDAVTKKTMLELSSLYAKRELI